MSNDIWSKLGIYDLLAVFFSGLSAVTLFLFTFWGITQENLIHKINTVETVGLAIASYVIGVCLQEFGSLLWGNKSSYALKMVFGLKQDNGKCKIKKGPKTKITLTEKEIKEVSAYISKKIGVFKTDYDSIYNYCKFDNIKNNNMINYDKDQAISAMSRSLAIVFLTYSALAFIYSVIEWNIIAFWVMIASVLVSIMLIKRMVRFMRLRYVNIIRSFYYFNIDKIKMEKKD